jgi:hypothetical protein
VGKKLIWPQKWYTHSHRPPSHRPPSHRPPSYRPSYEPQFDNNTAYYAITTQIKFCNNITNKILKKVYSSKCEKKVGEKIIWPQKRYVNIVIGHPVIGHPINLKSTTTLPTMSQLPKIKCHDK